MKEIVLVMGYNAAGKTTLVDEYVEKGYHRINRDLLGGTLDGLCDHAKKAHENGHEKLVLDNTYINIAARKSIIDYAKKSKSLIHCVHLTTSFEDAQFNACTRMVRKHGRLLTPEEMAKTKNPNDFPPVALFNYKKNFEKPVITEGFDTIGAIPFVRKKDPVYCNEAIIFDYDDTLRFTKGTEFQYPTDPKHVNILPGRKEKIKQLLKENKLILGLSNQSGIAKKTLTEETAKACFKRTNELLEAKIDVLYCPHYVPPVVCYCRKPQCGMGVVLIERYKLDASKCLFVGDQKTDETCAKRCGFQYQHPDQYFS